MAHQPLSVTVTRGAIKVRGEVTTREEFDWLVSSLEAAANVTFPRVKLYNVIMSSHGDNKISVIKEIRSLVGNGLAEAKDISERPGSTVNSSPLDYAEARRYIKALAAHGAAVHSKEIEE